MADYASEKNRKYLENIRALVKELPPFCAEFFRGIENTTSVLTRYGYAIDLKIFFTFLLSQIEAFKGLDMRGITLKSLDDLRAEHLEIFLEYLNYYLKADQPFENHERAKARKLSTLRSLFKYFFKKEKLKSNVAALVDLPKLHEKPIVRLEPNEVANLLDSVEEGGALTPVQLRYHKYTRVRDIAILSLFLGTGIRISELVGINVDDISFEEYAFKITRKGGKQTILYFGEEVAGVLQAYLQERNSIIACTESENAFFLSLQRRRITPRSVQNLVKKYSKTVVPLKNISPHKLRSTYGTMLYQETGDIYLVADVLGHKDVNTTKKHYAAQSEQGRRIAAKAIKLRE